MIYYSASFREDDARSQIGKTIYVSAMVLPESGF